MIGTEMTEALNKQINAEMYSAYLYLSMSSYSSFTGLTGAANWFFVQAQEEMAHAQKIYNYVNSTGGHVALAAIEQPPVEFKSLTHMFEATLTHEQKVTGLINNLAEQAVSEGDHATQVFLQWFVAEQVEEEESANDVLVKVKLAGEASGDLSTIDKELASRAFSPPSDQAKA